MKVLIVDDSVTMQKIEINQLHALGISDIVTANNGQDGLKVLAEHMPVDVILLDINMPVLDGMEMLIKIRENSAYTNVKVIMVTSESEKEKVLEAIRAGANDYIVKPFQPEDFKTRVQPKQGE